VLAPTHTCTTANDLVNDSRCVPQRPCQFPIALIGDSRLLVVCRAAVSSSRVALRPSCRARSVGTELALCALTLKDPFALMGDSRLARCLQGGGVFVDAGSTVSIVNSQVYSNRAGYVRALQNFPSPRRDFHMFQFVLAGRWCRCCWRHHGHLIVHHQWEHSPICAR
jgi:hypothetical protein